MISSGRDKAMQARLQNLRGAPGRHAYRKTGPECRLAGRRHPGNSGHSPCSVGTEYILNCEVKKKTKTIHM